MAKANIEIIYESNRPTDFARIAAAMEDFVNTVQCTVQDNPALHIQAKPNMMEEIKQRLTISAFSFFIRRIVKYVRA